MHLLLEGVPYEPYLTPGELYEWLLTAPAQIGMTRIAPPQVMPVEGGMAGLVLIAESHISVHYLPLRTHIEPVPEAGDVTWPDPRAWVDLFSCKLFGAEEAVAWIRRTLRLSKGPKPLILGRGLEYEEAPVRFRWAE